MYATLGIDDKQFLADLAKDKKALQDVGTAAKGSSDSLSDMFKVTGGMQLSNLLTGAKDRLIDLAKSSIDLASDLQQVQNVVDVTFGDGADTIDAWARTAKNAYGISELKAKQFNGTMGALLKSSGVADDQLIEMSTTITGLAADMASFYNLEHEEAFEKIRSGLMGETEPLKALGINMSVANLEAFALAQGITKSYNAMTQAEQTTLRYQLLLSQTADAQGDFTATAQEYANALSTFKTNMDTIATAAGQIGVDIVTPVLNTINGWFDGDAFQTEMDGIAKEQAETVRAAFADYNVTQGILQDLKGLGQVEDKLVNLTADTQTAIDQQGILAGAAQGVSEILPVAKDFTGINDGLTDMKQLQQDMAESTDEWRRAVELLMRKSPGMKQFISETDFQLNASIATLEKYNETMRDVTILTAQQTSLTAYEKAYQEQETAIADAQIALMEAFADADALPLYRRVMAYIDSAPDLPWKPEDKSAAAYIIEQLAEGQLGNTLENDAAYALQYAFDDTLGRKAQGKISDVVTDLDSAEKRLLTVGDLIRRTREAIADTSEEAMRQKEYKDMVSEAVADTDRYITKLHELVSIRDEAVKSAEDTLRASVGIFDDVPNLAELYRSVTGEDSMLQNLQHQEEYFRSYAADLLKARDIGLDEGLLALLSDGSEQSVADLHQIVNASDAEVDALNKQWQATKEQMGIAAEGMANNVLEVDKTFQEGIAGIKETVAELNLYEETKNAMQGIVDAMAEENAYIMAELARTQSLMDSLGGWGLTAPRITPYNPGAPASNAKGLDRVPFDDYLTYLHRDEMILNRAEAEEYRATRNGAAIDYTQLGAAVAQAMEGFTVSMDGRKVGELVASTVSRRIAHDARM